jgi:hypothetical protein
MAWVMQGGSKTTGLTAGQELAAHRENLKFELLKDKFRHGQPTLSCTLDRVGVGRSMSGAHRAQSWTIWRALAIPY